MLAKPLNFDFALRISLSMLNNIKPLCSSKQCLSFYYNLYAYFRLIVFYGLFSIHLCLLEDLMPKSVLFVCYGNACRSIMAEALARHNWGEKLEVASAGVSALGYIPEETKKVLEEIGVSTDGLYSKGLSEMDINGFHLILDLVLYPLEGMLPPSFEGKVISWHVRDPFMEGLDSFRQTRNDIEWLVTEKLSEWLDGE